MSDGLTRSWRWGIHQRALWAFFFGLQISLVLRSFDCYPYFLSLLAKLAKNLVSLTQAPFSAWRRKCLRCLWSDSSTHLHWVWGARNRPSVNDQPLLCRSEFFLAKEINYWALFLVTYNWCNFRVGWGMFKISRLDACDPFSVVFDLRPGLNQSVKHNITIEVDNWNSSQSVTLLR